MDAARGEPITFDSLLDELQSTRVIYLGEHHTVARHHEFQQAILDASPGAASNWCWRWSNSSSWRGQCWIGSTPAKRT